MLFVTCFGIILSKFFSPTHVTTRGRFLRCLTELVTCVCFIYRCVQVLLVLVSRYLLYVVFLWELWEVCQLLIWCVSVHTFHVLWRGTRAYLLGHFLIWYILRRDTRAYILGLPSLLCVASSHTYLPMLGHFLLSLSTSIYVGWMCVPFVLYLVSCCFLCYVKGCVPLKTAGRGVPAIGISVHTLHETHVPTY